MGSAATRPSVKGTSRGLACGGLCLPAAAPSRIAGKPPSCPRRSVSHAHGAAMEGAATIRIAGEICYLFVVRYLKS